MKLGFSTDGPAELIVSELSLGRRGTVDTTVPDGDECEHIAALLRKGVTTGVGRVMWDMRAPVGVRLHQAALDEAADCIEEGHLSGMVESLQEDGHPGADVQWRVVIRR